MFNSNITLTEQSSSKQLKCKINCFDLLNGVTKIYKTQINNLNNIFMVTA